VVALTVPQAYTFHKRSCLKSKKWLSCALKRAKEVWHTKKCQKTEETATSTAAECSPNYNVAAEQLSTYIIVAGIHSQV